MTTPTNHTVAFTNRFGNTITAPDVHVKDLGGGKAECHVETSYYIEFGYAHPAVYSTPSSSVHGRYVAHGKEFTPQQTYIYRGEFTRT